MIRTSRGFTLIELMIAIAMFGIVISLIMNARIPQQNQGVTQQQAVEMQQTVRSVINLMASDLRSAGYNPHLKDYNPGITNAAATTLTFTRVANDDGVNNDGDAETDEDGELETITYTLQDSDGDGDMDITVNKGAGARLLAENIQNLAFAYLDQNGAVTAVLDSIRSVQISITVTTDINELARSAANNTRTLTTLVYFRNLGF